MSGDARLPVGWNRPHNPKVAGSNPAPRNQNTEALLALSWRGFAFGALSCEPDGRDPGWQPNLLALTNSWRPISDGSRCQSPSGCLDLVQEISTEHLDLTK